MDFTATWFWPQWTVVALLFVGFAMNATRHGKPRLVEYGADKGKPEARDGFTALARVAIWLFVLIAGGFFA